LGQATAVLQWKKSVYGTGARTSQVPLSLRASIDEYAPHSLAAFHHNCMLRISVPVGARSSHVLVSP
jgi:hypothetical protein